MQWHAGTMGFSYPDWKGVFYGKGVKAGELLPAYARVFDSLELDTTFHACPTEERVAKWTEAVPAGFTFCVKTPRTVTHDAPIAFGWPMMKEFLRVLSPMRGAGKLGCVLVQFPPTFAANEMGNLEKFLKELPGDVRFAVEFRHPTWEIPRTAELLTHYGICWATGDYGVDPFPIHRTAGFLYLRLIGVHGQFGTHERERIDMTDRLAWWVEQATAPELRVETIYLFANNDYAGHSPETIRRLRRLLGMPVEPAAAERGEKGLFSGE